MFQIHFDETTGFQKDGRRERSADHFVEAQFPFHQTECGEDRFGEIEDVDHCDELAKDS